MFNMLKWIIIYIVYDRFFYVYFIQFNHRYENKHLWDMGYFLRQPCVQWNAAQQQAERKELASRFLLFLLSGQNKPTAWLLQVKEILEVQNFIY